MCTAITLQTTKGENFFGRTMDFSYPIEPELFVVSKGYKWRSSRTGERYIDKYSFIFIGQLIDDLLGIFDGVNEKGVAVANLYFNGYAYYDLPAKGKTQVSSLDFTHYLLGSCSSVDDLHSMLKNITIIGEPDPVTKSEAPLHWIVTDRTGRCAVIEQTKTGLKLSNNPIGVITNSPDFSWHMTNLRNYMETSVKQQDEVYWGKVQLKPFGQAGGTVPLPGGFTSPERFVRSAFLKTHAKPCKNSLEAIMTFFHIMYNVFIPKGVVITPRGTQDYTQYTSLINTQTCEYYFKTYDNDGIITAGLWDYCKKNGELISLGSIIRKPVMFEKF